MAIVGGDILEVSCNHPVLGTKIFQLKGSEDSSYDFGGYTSASDQAAVTGSGSMMDSMNRKRPFFEVTAAWDMSAGDLEFAQACQNSPVRGDWTISHINGSVHGLVGKPVGDLQGNGNASTFTLRVEGGGTMRKIA